MARVGPEVSVGVGEPITARTVLDAVEASYPMLRGTIRDHASKQRRAYLRYFACGEDISFVEIDAPLPPEVASGDEPFIDIGAIAGG
jgi:hypothetical protein